MWSLLFGSDNYKKSQDDKDFDSLLDKCNELKKEVEAKRYLGHDATDLMQQWKVELNKLDILNTKIKNESN